MNSLSFDIWHVAISVKNLDASVSFYTSLGFQLLGSDETSSKYKAFVATKPGGFCLELFQSKQEQSHHQQPDHLAFECSDIDAFRSFLSHSPGLKMSAIDTFDNGVKCFRLRDPDGIPVQFFQGRSIFEQSIMEKK